MAVIKTGAIFKSLTFDGIDSRTYGVYITGEAVFNAPTRRVNMIQIPGRNGLFAQDEGAFDNLTVTYPAGLFGVTEADFADAISNFRNALCSRVGYKRLEDDYNPSEFRMAVYKEGLEVTPATLKAGEFTITFECKPQRFLKSGETATTITDGATLTNPTLFEAKPLIEAVGYGEISLAGQVISVQNSPLGFVELWGSQETAFPPSNLSPSSAYSFDGSLVANGDEIDLLVGSVAYSISGTIAPTDMSVTGVSGFDSTWPDLYSSTFYLYMNDISFIKGTARTVTASATLNYTISGTARTKNVTLSIAYDGNQTITMSATGGSPIPPVMQVAFNAGALQTYSSVNAAGTLYIDTELGLAWWDESGTMVDANSAVMLPASLPVLAPGANVINFDNTYSSLKIAPRWWIV